MHVTENHRAPLSFAFGLLLVAVSTACAQLPATRLSSVFPPGGRAGSTVEVAAQGADFDEPAGLEFSHSGITASAIDLTKFKVTIASNVPPGVYDARYVGRFGLSNPRRFMVGTLPERIAPSTNGTRAGAIEVSINSTWHSRIPSREVAWYRFSAKKAQRVFVECLAESLDSRMDATLALLDAEGLERDRSRTGGTLDFTAPADGTYYIRVADFLYRGGDDYFYRLTLSTGPRVDYILPLAGVAGTKTNFTVYGRNLPGGKPAKGLAIDGRPLEQVSVPIVLPGAAEERMASSLPASAALDTIEYRFKGANPVLIALVNSNAPIGVEREPNSKPAQAQKISPPCGISGQFFPASDVDRYVFSAKKGDVYRVEVMSHRLGMATAPQLLVQRLTKNDKGVENAVDVLELGGNDLNLGEREFNTASRDPAGRFEAKEDGTYRIEVRDLFSPTVANPRNTYHLSIRRETPDFRLVAQVVAPKYKADAKNIEHGASVIRRGESLPVRVMAFRSDGFDGEIALSLENPPPGLSLVADRIEAGKGTDTVLLTAAADAPPYAGPLRVVGRARIGDREIVRTARGGSLIFPVGSVDTERPEARATRRFEFAVSGVESAPITIAPSENRPWEAPANGKLEVPLSIVRRAEFNAKLKLKPLGPGPADALKEFEVEGSATNAILKLDLAALKLSPGRHVYAVQSITTGKYRNNPEAAAFAEAAAKEADKSAGEAAAAAKKAAEELEKAKKDAAAAEADAKVAGERLAALTGAAEKAPSDEKLKADVAVARKAHDDAMAGAAAAAVASAKADKAKAAAEVKAKEAQAKKDEAAKRAKEANDKAKPRDVSYQVTSAPIVVQVTPAPVAENKGKESKQVSK